MRFWSKYGVVVLVALALGVALFLRIAVPYHLIFTDSGVRFADADPYSHMRLVDNTLQHFPTRTPFDPYTYFPEGAPVYYPPLFTLFLSGTIWLFSLGAPTAHSIDVIGALFPAVLGVVTVVPVFYIGKTLVNKWAGALAALLIAIMPGEFLGRTMLGYTDHHVVEVLFTTIAMLFLMLAVKSARERELTLWPLDWARARKPLLFSLLAGLFLGLYLQMWAGGPIFVLILLLYFAAQFILDHFKGQSSAYLVIAGTVMMATASLITLPFLPKYYSVPLYIVGLGGVTAAPILLFFVSKFVRALRLPAFAYPAALAVACGGAALLLRAANPELFSNLAANFNILHPSNVEQTIGEVDPLLFPAGSFTLSAAWLNFAMGFFLAPVMLGIFVWQAWKHDEPHKVVLIVWSLCTLILTLGQRRFAYYYAVNVAVLTMCLAWAVLKWAGFREESLANEIALKKESRRKPAREIARRNVLMGGALVAIFFFVIMPDLPPALDTVKAVPYAPDLAWEQALTWLRDNSPPPFGSQDAYYDVIVKTNPGQYYAYPASAYGVLAWWDYGHWITRIAHRIPNNAPGGGRSPRVAQCLLAQDEETARQYMKELNSLYIMADFPTEIYKFYAVCEWAGTTREDYFDSYYQAQDGALKPVVLFYPEFYRTMLVRLYSFEGRAVTPSSTTVITYEERQIRGSTVKLVTDAKRFESYVDAQAYIASQPAGHLKIVGTSPFVSPVPLEALSHFRLVNRSPASTDITYKEAPTPVKTFINLDGLWPTAASTDGKDSHS